MKRALALLLVTLLFAASPVFSLELDPAKAAESAAQEKLKKVVSVSFTGADLRNVLNGLAKTYDLNIVAEDKVKGTVNITLKDVPLEDALRRILKSSGYTYRAEGSVLEVVSLEEEMSTEILPLRFLQSDIALEFIKGNASETGVMKIDETLNSILVTDRLSRIEKMKEVLEKIDVPPQQVLIEAKLLDITHTDLDNLGWAISSTAFKIPIPGSGGADRALDFSAGAFNLPGSSADLTTDTFSLTIAKGAETMTVAIDALIRDKQTKVLANPTVVTLNNVEAKITIGEKFPIQETTQTTTGTLQTTRFVDVGITLRVTPKINRQGYIQMQIHPEVSSVSATLDQGPRITTREADTTVIVKERESVVIAGLLQDNDEIIKDRIPILGHLPFIGTFFQSRSKKVEQKELIVVITPYLVPVLPPQVAQGSVLQESYERINVMDLYLQAEDMEMVRSLQARKTPERLRILHAAELYEQIAARFPDSPLAPDALLRAGVLRWTRLNDPVRASELLSHLTARYPGHPQVLPAQRKIREIQSHFAEEKEKEQAGHPDRGDRSGIFPGFR